MGVCIGVFGGVKKGANAVRALGGDEEEWGVRWGC